MKGLTQSKSNNVFTTFLNYLDVKYTSKYANRLFNEHPHKYNLFGLSKMLSDYHIENAAIKIDDKREDILKLETPFVAHAGGDFSVITNIDQEKISYTWQGKDLSSTIDEFCNIWTGVTLIAEPSEESIEPDYKEHQQKALFGKLQNIAIIAASCILLIIAFLNNTLYLNVGSCLLIIINIIGLYIGYLLVLKQMHMQSEYADKICSLFKKGDCNDILGSEAAKLVGEIGWSEVGLGYFLANMLILFFMPSSLPYLVLINICALPYSFWSVWYQKSKAKQWCTLCLIVQVLLWTIFIVSLIFNFVQWPVWNITDILITGCLYVIPIFVINQLIPKVSEKQKNETIIQELNSIKADENVFFAMLKKQPYYEVDRKTSSILWGNLESKILVTVLTNPHCNPCAKMHKRIENVLNETNNLCIQYMFSSFNEDLDSSNKLLSAIYIQQSEQDRKTTFDNWFEFGKNNEEDFLTQYNVNVEDESVQQEFEKHEAWKNSTGLRTTPTILVNGYKLPNNYKIEDLMYL